MARASKVEKAASRARILDAAARLYRENGISATSVGDVMNAAGMTHGGFYRHFSSKEELVAAAIDKASLEFAGALESRIESEGATKAISDYVDTYLSEQHVESPGAGCPLAALSQEAGRGAQVYRDAVAGATQRIAGLLERGVNKTGSNGHETATGLLATLVGTVVLARSTEEESTRREILRAGRSAAKTILAKL